MIQRLLPAGLVTSSGLPSGVAAVNSVTRLPYDWSVYMPGDQMGMISTTESRPSVGTATSTSNVFEAGLGMRTVYTSGALRDWAVASEPASSEAIARL